MDCEEEFDGEVLIGDVMVIWWGFVANGFNVGGRPTFSHIFFLTTPFLF